MKQFLILFFLLFFVPTALAHEHYSFEHAQEMYESERIDWQDYGPKAFEIAQKDNKPIFLMLTAPSWCYWCHVYTSDDYVYHDDVYPVINEQFIPVYVDADKRQDLTRHYLEGGWPSTTILTPARERLFGYSGPRPTTHMVENLHKAAKHVQENTNETHIVYDYTATAKKPVTVQELQTLINRYGQGVLNSYDPQHGGFGQGQKFPQGRALDFALDIYELTQEQSWIKLVEHTLDNQYTAREEITSNYNLFDPIEGGFHRYGTQRDWTPPHYEKMLYDNVRLVRAYHHLHMLKPENVRAQEVVEKTLSFISTNWYDHEAGGFYGNSDVHGENHYYGKIERGDNPPRVEQTKYTDWNSDAIITYLDLWERSGNETFKDMAEQSLDFFQEHMIGTAGAYHYINIQGEKAVQGNLLDNAYLLLAFVEASETLEEQKYLVSAKKLADYTITQLYDWHSGGFFERNSKEHTLYAPGEQIVLSKPSVENGIMSYALLKLYTQTNDTLYLGTGMRTLGAHMYQIGHLDRGYYSLQAALYAVDQDLVQSFQTQQVIIEEHEMQEEAHFWVDTLLEAQEKTPFIVSQTNLTLLDGPFLLLLFIAFLAGLLSFLSPCTLPILPAYLAYTLRASKKNIVGMTVAFFFGLTLIFTLLGMSATFIGSFLQEQSQTFTQFTGLLIIFFGVYTLLGKGFSGLTKKQSQPTSYFGAFFFGGALGLSWTPCVGPILVAILLLASIGGSIFGGGFLLFMYGVGLALPLVTISLLLKKINTTGKIWQFIQGYEIELRISKKTYSFHSSMIISGLLLVVLGVLMFNGSLYTLNQYVGTSSVQQSIIQLEETLLRLLP